MWAIENFTPYKAERAWARDKNGVHEWIVAVKATFDITSDGSLALADEQLEPLLMPEYSGEDGLSSLRYDADVVALKPTTDVVVNGTAYAPNGRPSNEFPAGVQIHRIRKMIKVVGNRWWQPGLAGLQPSVMEPIIELPIVYERAFGGFDQTDPDPKKQRIDLRNPVGCGIAARADHKVGQALPNFEYPDKNIEKAGPAGFGAIASHWSPRRELCGTYDEAWQNERHPLLPEDWDPRSRLCSPADQRPETHLRGGEPVALLNLTRDGAMRFALPRIFLSFTTHLDGRTEDHPGHLASVIIEPDDLRLIMVWHTTLVCLTDIDYLDKTVIREKPFI